MKNIARSLSRHEVIDKASSMLDRGCLLENDIKRRLHNMVDESSELDMRIKKLEKQRSEVELEITELAEKWEVKY